MEERKDALAKYMNELVQHFNIFADPDVCAFISMKDKDKMRTYLKDLYEYQESFLKLSGSKVSDVSDRSGNSDEQATRSPNKVPANPLKQSFTCQSKFQSNIESEQKVLDLLDALEHDQDKFSNHLKSFEEYFFVEKPLLSTNYIKRLLFGDGYKQRGLFQHIKDVEA